MLRQGSTISYQDEELDRSRVDGTQYRRTMTFRAGEALEAAELVMIDTSDSTGFLGRTVIAASGGADGTNAQLVVGVTLEEAEDGDEVEVVVAGYCYVQADGAVAAGNALTNDGAVDGQVHAATIGTHEVIGVALEADGAVVSGQSWILLYPRA